jgi:hypothetical protein
MLDDACNISRCSLAFKYLPINRPFAYIDNIISSHIVPYIIICITSDVTYLLLLVAIPTVRGQSEE